MALAACQKKNGANAVNEGEEWDNEETPSMIII